MEIVIFGSISILCLFAYISINWLEGNDTSLSDVTMMTILAIIPIVNLIVLLFIVASQRKIVVLKGKKRNDY